MIQTLRDRQAEGVFHGLPAKRLTRSVVRGAMRKLLLLDAAEALQDLATPAGNRLEELRGDREDQDSIRVNDQWRICFRRAHGDAYQVGLTDYH